MDFNITNGMSTTRTIVLELVVVGLVVLFGVGVLIIHLLCSLFDQYRECTNINAMYECVGTCCKGCVVVLGNVGVGYGAG